MKNTIQLRNYHLKQGRNNDRTPIYPLTKPEAILGLDAYLSKVGTGVVPFDSMPEKVVPGTIYYNTAEDKYYISDASGALKPLKGVGSIAINGQSRPSNQQGVVDLSELFDVDSQQDGTVVITIGGNTYTIDLSHTHQQYARKKEIVSTSESSITLDADKIMNLGTVAGNKTISLPATVDAAAEYEVRFTYSSGTITLPSGAVVANGDSQTTIEWEAGLTYHIIISGNVIYYSATELS